MKSVLKLATRLKEELWRHLLSDEERREQAAFLFCTQTVAGDETIFDVVEYELLRRSDFAAQHSDYLELTDEARVRLIMRAHVLKACLVELHSHPWAWPAELSWSDRSGLKETVPHMRWRLKERPYLAVVVALTSYDALVWAIDARRPEMLVIEVGGELLQATGRSLEGWDERA